MEEETMNMHSKRVGQRGEMTGNEKGGSRI